MTWHWVMLGSALVARYWLSGLDAYAVGETARSGLAPKNPQALRYGAGRTAA
jgi:hypothetical protein